MKVFQRLEAWVVDAPRSLTATALVRIVVGTSIFLMVLVSFWGRKYYWGDASGWQDPQREISAWGHFPFNFFVPHDPDWLLALKLIFVALLGVFIAFGFLTRVSTFLAFFFVGSLGGLSPYSADSGDNLVRILLFYMIFTYASGKWSIDLWLREKLQLKSFIPTWLRNVVHNFGLVAIGAQTIIIYIIAGITKARGETWLDGSALYYALNIEQFVPWPALNSFFGSIAPFVMLLTWSTLILQILFPLLLLSHYTRVAIIFIMMTFHLGIAVFMGLGIFSFTMFAADLIFIRDGELSWVRRLISKRLPKKRTTAALTT